MNGGNRGGKLRQETYRGVRQRNTFLQFNKIKSQSGIFYAFWPKYVYDAR